MPRGISKRQLGKSRYSMSISTFIHCPAILSSSFWLNLALFRASMHTRGAAYWDTLSYSQADRTFMSYRTGIRENFEVFIISRFSWVADDTKIIHVEGGINTREIV